MNRAYLPHRGALEAGVAVLFADLTIGSSGAVTLSRGHGIASAVKTATGVYTLTLEDSYNRLLAATGTLEASTGADSATVATRVELKSSDVSASTPVVVLGTRQADGSAAHPASGTVIHVMLTVKASSADE